MIATKILGLTATLSKSKKVKIGILLLEVALLAYALNRTKEKDKDSITELDINKLDGQLKRSEKGCRERIKKFQKKKKSD